MNTTKPNSPATPLIDWRNEYDLQTKRVATMMGDVARLLAQRAELVAALRILLDPEAFKDQAEVEARALLAKLGEDK